MNYSDKNKQKDIFQMHQSKLSFSPFIGSLIITIVIFYGSFSPDTGGIGIIDKLGLNFKNSDKLIHLLFYLLLSISIYWGFIRQKTVLTKNIIHIYSLSIPFIIGGFVEIIQGCFIQSRQGEIEDMAANTIGIIIGFLIYQIYLKHYNR